MNALLLALALLIPPAHAPVVVTQSGLCYHVPNAPHLRRYVCYQITRAEADSARYEPCRLCYSPPKVKPFSKLPKVTRGAA